MRVRAGHVSAPIDHRERHTVERGISRLTGHRALATRYDKPAAHYGTTVLSAAIDKRL